MFKRLMVLICSAIVLSACNSSNNSGGTTTNGTLEFNQNTYQVASNSLTEVILSLSGSNSTSGVSVTLSSSNNNIAVVTQSQCVLSDESGFPNSCEVKIKGVSAGSTTITASAAGVAVANATVSVGSAVVPGTLAFTPVSEQATAGSDARVVLSLNGSSGVENLEVGVVSNDPTVANPLHSSCILSTLERTCTVIVDAEKIGNAVITASAAGYASATNAINVTNDVVTGTLNFDGNKQIQVSNTGTAKLSLSGSSGTENVLVSFSTQNSDATILPSTCTLSSAKPSCNITITGAKAGSDTITATASGYASANMVANIVAAPVNGNFYFSSAQESVVANSSGSVDLIYSGGSGVADLPVTVSSNNSNIIISANGSNVCQMSNTHGLSVCPVKISGITPGQSIIKASAAGYPDSYTTVTVLQSGAIVYGKLKLHPSNSDLMVGSSEPMVLTLEGSSNVNNLVVNLSSAASGIESLSQSSCSLSTVSNSCSFNVTGQSNGSTVISASNSLVTSGAAKASVTVTAKAASYFVFSPDELILSNQTQTAQTSTLTLVNPPESEVSVGFTGNSAFGYSPGICSFSKAKPTCVVNVNNAVVGGPTGTFALVTTQNSDPSIANVKLPIIIAPAIAVSRTITVINMCPFTVYAGISGGSANLTKGPKPGTCPTGTYDMESTDPATGYELCYWKNPTPTNGYKLTNNTQTQFVIPVSTVDTVGAMWGGGVMARLKLNESWVIGQCNAGQESLGDVCAVGVGFSVPETVAEITMIPSGADTFDLQLINGVTVPISMAPDGVTADSGNPYMNGVAGSTSVQTGTQYTLKASSWQFNPSSTGLVGATTSATYYNYVSGTSGSTDQCTADVGGSGVGCTGNVNGPVCGYAANSLANTNGNPPTYARVCGYRLAYLTGAAIYTMNPSSSNTAPFDFNSVLYTGAQSTGLPYPNSNSNPMHDFYLCNAGAAQSGYQATTVYPQACGCANWDTMGIATPTKQCQGTGVASYNAESTGIGFNSAWLNEVLPRVQWAKQGVPTAYSFPYDDPSSTFSGYQPASSTNAANAVNYTVTFCPGGKTIPNYDPNLQ